MVLISTNRTNVITRRFVVFYIIFILLLTIFEHKNPYWDGIWEWDGLLASSQKVNENEAFKKLVVNNKHCPKII